jgi:hypothetical protein
MLTDILHINVLHKYLTYFGASAPSSGAQILPNFNFEFIYSSPPPPQLYFDVPYDFENEQLIRMKRTVMEAGVVFCEVVTESLNIIHTNFVLQRREILHNCTYRRVL